MFIKRLEYRGKYYVYDANSNMLTSISKQLFDELENNVFLFENIEFTDLYEKGYFREYGLKEIHNPFTDKIKYLNDRNLSYFIFQVTQGCNLKCAYCPYSQTNDLTRHHTNLHMNWQVAKKALDFYLEHSIDSNFIGIGFYGGEPLINMKLIQQIVEYSKEVFEGKEIHYSITTNLTLLTEEIMQYLEKNEFQLLISLDGNKEATDTNRKFGNDELSVFDIVIKKLKSIYDKYESLFKKSALNVVLDPKLSVDLYDDLINQYDFIKEMNLYAVKKDDTYSDEKNITSEEFIDSYNYKMFLCYLELLDGYDFEKETKLFQSQKRLLEKELNEKPSMVMPNYIEKISSTSGVCLPGMTKTFVSTSGNFYSCERVNENLEDMIIGDVNEGYSIKRLKNFLNFNSKFKDRCLHCFAMRECNLCPEQFGASGLELNEKSLEVCLKEQNDFIQILKDRIVYSEIRGM